MPIRNPFARRPGPQDEHLDPASAADIAHPGFERVDTVGSKASSVLSIHSRRSQDTGEYKMSVVNDSGVYLPPSPTEQETSWPKRYLSSRTSMETRSSFGDIEQFSISRESFDSYRRSFDVSARTPVVVADPAPRQSLDSARFPRRHHPRSALAERRFDRPEPATEEEEFEDVGLGEDGSGPQQQQQQQTAPAQQPRKRGFLSKFTTGNDAASTNSQDQPPSPAPTTNATQGPLSMARFLPGRRRAQSGQGAELEPMSPADGHRSVVSVVEAQEANP